MILDKAVKIINEIHLVFLRPKAVLTLCLLLQVTFSTKTSAQDPFFERLPIKEESFKSVYSVFEDNQGFIWFATDVGIFRYDGRGFSQPYKDKLDIDYEVFDIYEDSQNEKWLMTFKGDVLKTQGDSLILVRQNTDDIGYLTGFHETKEFFILISNHGYLLQFDKNLFLKTRLKLPFSPREVVVLDENRLLIFGLGRTAIYSPKTTTFNGFSSFPHKNFVPRYHHNSEYVFIGGGSTLKIRKLDSFDEIYKSLELPRPLEIIDISQHVDQLYLGTRKGYYTLDLKNYSFSNLHLEGKAVSKTLVNSEGILWCTTLNSGIYSAKTPGILGYYESNSLLHASIHAVHVDKKGMIWAGANDNILYRFSKDFKLQDTTKIQLYRGDRTTSITEIEDEIWVASKTGIAIFKGQEKSPDLIPLWANNLHYDAEKQELWILGKQTLRAPISVVNSKRVKHVIGNKYYISNQFDFEQFDTGKANDILLTDTTSWIGSIDGIKKMVHGKFCKSPFPKLNLRDETISLSKFGNHLIFGTKSNGVFVTLKDSVVANFHKGNSILQANSILDLYPFEDIVYVGTNAGLYELHIKDNKALIEHTNFGLQNETIRAIAHKNGHLFLGTDNGLIRTEMGAAKMENELLLYLDSLTGYSNYKSLDSYSLNYPNRSLSIYLTALYYKVPRDIIYQYRLLPNGLVWKSSESSTIHLESLAEGNYSIELRAKAGDLVSRTYRIELQVIPPFWRNWAFQLLALFFLGSLAVIVVKIRMRKLKRDYAIKSQLSDALNKKLALEKKAIEMEHQALRMQMNPHFIFNAINTIKGFYAENNRLKANNYIVKFSKLLRHILESDTKLVSLENEVEFIYAYLYLNKIRFQGKLNYRVEIDESMQPELVLVPPMLIQPFLENALIHAFKKTHVPIHNLSVAFKKEAEQIRIAIEDDGVGIDFNGIGSKSFSGKRSVSIQICKERLQLFEEEKLGKTGLIIENLNTDQKRGTRVTIVFPYLES